MSILNNLRNDVAAASAKAQAATPASTERKPSDFWLNIGINIPGPEGKPVFVSLPIGLALDDMKAVTVKGTNQEWINLAQTKNALLEALQLHAASMKPGERQHAEALSVEIYRRNEPQQTASSTSDNPLLASLMASLSKAA